LRIIWCKEAFRPFWENPNAKALSGTIVASEGIITMREKVDDVADDEMSLDISFPQF
jgi:hypothetical protein